MKTTNKRETSAQVADVSQPERILTYDGKAEFEAYVVWRSNIQESVSLLRDQFNSDFDEVLGSKTRFDKTWLLDFYNRKGLEKLKMEVDKFISIQNKALRLHYEDHYHEKIEGLKARIQNVIEVLNQSGGNGYILKNFPFSLISISYLPFKNGTIDNDPAEINALRESFNEYLTNPDDILFHNMMKQIADGYNGIKNEIQRRNLNLDIEYGMKGIPSMLDRDESGNYKPSTTNLKFALSITKA
ncbi:hypothetical protein [Mucilaginibacter paludis]|uniref:Uncharacterized protein n=1 Tax=Mucilaginibacter paludis DSM 18603 TaxID=714943 RepID=H1Y7B9_9SPHI|nr:hypothetical protein [Mucilaginibacter paludis]EHQ29006.1 hypothetical protein Mucpa_4922 [Mucilaginibacter paludis DSM 18603]